MLRLALDAAEGARRDAIPPPIDSENASLTQESDATSRGYGSTSLATKTEEGEGDDTEGSGSYDEDSASYMSADEWNEALPPDDRFQRCWRAMRDCFVLMANVDNLWDDSEASGGESSSLRNHLVVLFWFFLLATAYAGERSTFYLLVDRSGPFRLFSAEMVTASHAGMLGIGMLVSAISRRNFSVKALGIPIVDVGLMALLDATALLLALITGYHVPPTLTVILVQLTIPLTVLFTQFVHPDGRCSGEGCRNTSERSEQEPMIDASSNDGDMQEFTPFNGIPLPGWGGVSKEHLWGSAMITTAVVLGLCPAFIGMIHPELFSYADAVPLRTAYNSLVFAFACVPAAASQLYKEHVFLQHKQPVDATYLNFLLSVFQFTFIIIVSPLVYTLQGMAAPGDWTALYPSTDFSANFRDGLKCFLGNLDEDQAQNRFSEPAICDYSLVIVLFHVFSIIVVGVAVDKIVNAGATKVMYRGISAGIILAVIAMYIYDLNDPDFNYGPVVDSLHFVCTMLLIFGSEVYHRVSVQDATFETVYPELDVLYDDDG